jgi:hypothetical protein
MTRDAPAVTRSVTRLSYVFHAAVTTSKRLSRVCHASVTRLSRGCHHSVTILSHGCHSSVTSFPSLSPRRARLSRALGS